LVKMERVMFVFVLPNFKILFGRLDISYDTLIKVFLSLD